MAIDRKIPARQLKGVPEGGLINQVLGKLSEEDYNTGWINQQGGDMESAVYDPQNIDNDAFARENHTGQQPISTITNLSTELGGLMPSSVYDPENGSRQVAFNDDLFTDCEPSTGNILFSPLNNKPRKYGFETSLTGDIVFETTGAKESIMVKARWNGSVIPNVSVLGGGVDLISGGVEFVVDVDNYLYAICHKNDAGTVISISYNINQNGV